MLIGITDSRILGSVPDSEDAEEPQEEVNKVVLHLNNQNDLSSAVSKRIYKYALEQLMDDTKESPEYYWTNTILKEIIKLNLRKQDELEKELEISIKKQNSIWHWNKFKPRFKDRFSYKGDYGWE